MFLIHPLQMNPDYKHTFVFTNDFSALLPDAPAPSKIIAWNIHYELIKIL